MKTDQPHPIYLKDYAPPPFLIDETRLDVALHPSETRVAAKLALRPNPEAMQPTRELKLNGEKLRLLRLRLDNAELAPDAYCLTDKHLTLVDVPPRPFTLEIETECDPESNKALSGLYRSNGIYCTQCEAEGFRRITYYLDRPDVLAKFEVRVEAGKKEAPVLLSNGNLVESGELRGGRHFAVWRDPFPKPSYLFALVAGRLAYVEDWFQTQSGRKVALRIYVEPGKEDRCSWAMDCLKRAMRWDEERFGLEYDLDIFMIVAVSDFNMGAMENKGLNIFNDAAILARPDTATDSDYERIETVVAHEYFHNWTGNRVTCRDWFQLCLKEGLTVFRDQEFTSDIRSRPVKRIADVHTLKVAQFPEDAGPLAHPVRPSSFIEINNFYTATVYEKGAEICRMLQTVLGREGFRRGLALYFKRHDGQAVTVEDFVAAMADANGADLGDFLTWYNQAGTPKLEARLSWSAANRSARLTLAQSYPPLASGAKRKPVPIPVKLGLVGRNGQDMLLRLNGKALPNSQVLLGKRKETFTFEGIGSRPILSLLREFSAPVNVAASLGGRDMLALVEGDGDPFNRWQMAQAFALNHLVALTAAAAEGRELKPSRRFLAALGTVANDDRLECAYRAAFLALPLEQDIALAIGENVDPEAVHTARQALRVAAGRALRKILEGVQDRVKPAEPYSPDPESAGRRALRHAALSLLAAGGSRFAAAKVKALARSAANMTETMAALTILSQMGDAVAYELALQRFQRKWKADPLVMDKWFSLQARSPQPGTLARIEELAAHPLFSLKNPNKVRAVYGAFAHGNQVRFNDKSGHGYALVANAIIEIDGFNPQIASRLTSAFESWRIFEPGRQSLAKAALRHVLSKDGLSADVFEIASKIVGAEDDLAAS